MKKAKILFLDIDGVLNYNRYSEDIYYDGDKQSEVLVEPYVPICKNCYIALEYIVANVPDLKVIWSTDWRCYPHETMQNGWKNPLAWIETNCKFLEGKIVGKTPKKMSSTRPEEIRMWLSWNEYYKSHYPDADEKEDVFDITGYAVLDDYTTSAMYSWFGCHFFKTWFDTGLTMHQAQQVVNCLNSEGYNKSQFVYK